MRLRAFSFARQAQEAATWWQGASCPLADGSTNPGEAAKAGASAAKMMGLHKGDPPLLASWTTPQGTLCSMLLWPMHAVSDQFPPDPHQWGMPLADASNTSYDDLLVPWNDPRALPFGAVPHPIEYPSTNQVYPQMMWRCSSWWAQDLPHSLGFNSLPLRFTLQPVQEVETDDTQGFNVPGIASGHGAPPKGGRTRNMYVGLQQAQLEGNLIVVQAPFHPPVPTPEAYRLQKQSKAVEGGDNGFFEIYNSGPLLLGQQTYAATLPGRVARMASWQEVARWCDGTPKRQDNQPQWLSEGLQNLFSLQTADFLIANQNTPENVLFTQISQSPRFSPLAIEWQQHLQQMADEARTLSEAAQPLDEPSSLYGTMGGGPPLEDEPSTQQVAYLYTHFGAGAVVELVQRLGEGESTDQALQATTGLTEEQLLTQAHAK